MQPDTVDQKHHVQWKTAVLSLLCFVFPLAMVSTAEASTALSQPVALTSHWVGFAALAIFVVAYLLVILEERLHMRKSKPVLLAASLIWLLIALVYRDFDSDGMVAEALQHNFLEYAELFFFLLVAMTYINAMMERGVFDALREWLVLNGFSYKTLFWLTGFIAFFLSPVADNLTTALIMCAVLMAVGQGNPSFVALGCVNIVVAANAGGAFSPFGDITTLMVWQKGVVEISAFLKLFLPSVVNYIVPAVIMYFALPDGRPAHCEGERVRIKRGGLVMVFLFMLTIATAVSFHNALHLPPVFGMMMGLAYLKFFSYYLRRKGQTTVDATDMPGGNTDDDEDEFDIFDKVAQAEWDTLFFFYGVILAVGGLGFIGYLGMVSELMYGELGATTANVLVGVLSAIVDNIPVMFAVLTMNPAMDETQWLLVTLTAGVGGSMLSIGSAAGVALMGQARGVYTFFAHLRWTPAIALGYAASIATHLWLNG